MLKSKVSQVSLLLHKAGQGCSEIYIYIAFIHMYSGKFIPKQWLPLPVVPLVDGHHGLRLFTMIQVSDTSWFILYLHHI